MSDIKERLDKVRVLIQKSDFLEGKGLSNEVNIRIFCYNPEDEMIVRHFVNQLETDQSLECHLSNQSSDLMEEAPYLVGTNAKADKINQAHMRALDEKTEKKFWAIIEGDVTYEDIKNISFAKQSLVVNVGAKVMLTANDANGEYVNGTMGTIIDISKERGDATCIQVLTDKGKKVDVYRYEREIERQDIEESKEKDKNGETVIVKKIVRKIVGSFKQFPIKIAWAMSIHKSQGQTFGQVNIDPRCWDSGQFYVAVSRAESVAGIHFMDLIRKQYIRTLSDEVIKILKESLYSII